ncbi:MAG: hypothetical protein CMJ27_13855 [Phycisphaerae bacterium]|nr:hypothetical protein [Phycisphaerae bacterium]OUW99848.1 MAG: hypothetical protein CBD91_07990 [Phycisphaeraceae bacterium TMED231]
MTHPELLYSVDRSEDHPSSIGRSGSPRPGSNRSILPPATGRRKGQTSRRLESSDIDPDRHEPEGSRTFRASEGKVSRPTAGGGREICNDQHQ